jgi:HSP20 family molecular chaperone IbpA
MKKIMTTMALLGALTLPLSAAELVGTPYDAEFAKMNQYFNSLIESHFSNAKLSNFNYPRVDIQDNNKSYIIKFDLAGVSKNDIKLSIDEHNILKLEGKKEEKIENKKENFIKKEIFYGSFERMIQLPENIDQSKLSTAFEDGILTVTIPKVEIKKPKAKIIPIK